MSTETMALTLENVEKVLDELRPFLMADGGNVEVVELDGPIVKVRLQGCGNCPSSDDLEDGHRAQDARVDPRSERSGAGALKRLFVYGSLKSSGSSPQLLKGAKRDRDGIVDGFVAIVHLDYPMLQRGEGSVVGEVYWVPDRCWPALDNWEEVPEVYQRSCVTLRDGRSAWLYEAA